MSLIDCPICFDSKSSLEITTLPCNCQACSDCLSDWITMKIQEQGRTVDQTIDCIISTCKKSFPIHSVYSNIPPLYQQKLDQALLQDYLSKDKAIRKCPKPGCTYAGIINLKAKCKDDISCQLCGTTWRDKSQLTWSQTIQNHFKRIGTSRDEALSSLWKGWKTKKCPNCKVDIQKNQGCSHMTCSRCSHQFCWVCKQQSPRHNFGVHLVKFLIPSVICVGLTVFGWRKFCAIPAVQRVRHSFIKPAVDSVKRALGKAARGTFRFLLTNLAFFGLAGIVSVTDPRKRNGFLILTPFSIGLVFSLQLHRQILRTLLIDLAISSGIFLLKRYQTRRFARPVPDMPMMDDFYQDVVVVEHIDSLPQPPLEDKMVSNNDEAKPLRRSYSA